MFDSHCHLTDKRYADLAEIIAAMPSDGLEGVVTVGYDTASSERAVAIASLSDRVWAAVGIHPTDLSHDTDIEKILSLAKSERVVAFGEIGLDYYWDTPDRATQKKFFELQLEAAATTALPIIIHSRECDGDILPILKRWAARLTNGVIMHCFSSSAEIVREYIKLGYYISFAGTITYKNAKRGDVIRAVPLPQLLAETDCPYLTPVPHRGETNYPAYVRYTIEKLAEERAVSFAEMETLTTANARRIFRLEERS